MRLFRNTIFQSKLDFYSCWAFRFSVLAVALRLSVLFPEVCSQTSRPSFDYEETTQPFITYADDELNDPNYENTAAMEGSTTEKTPEENVPDISPIIKEVAKSCCAIPSLDCSFAFNQQRKRRDTDDHWSSDNTTRTGSTNSHLVMAMVESILGHGAGGNNMTFMSEPGVVREDGGEGGGAGGGGGRKRRQVDLSDQFIDQLGINLLRFETCLCQSARPLSTCRMLFPPDYYKPSVPGVFDALFHVINETLLKRFACTFYAGNTVDCTFRASIRYPASAAREVTLEVDLKAQDSGMACGVCNSFFCTSGAFKKRINGLGTSFNDDYNFCMVDRTGLPLNVIFPPTPPPTASPRRPPRPMIPLPPLTYSQKYTTKRIPGLALLAHLMTSGFFTGLRSNLAGYSFTDRYSVRPSRDSRFHPILLNDHHDHAKAGYPLLKVVVAVVVGLVLGAIIMAIIIYLIYRRKIFNKNMPVQRSLRDLPIVKLDVLDPSPFCGGSPASSRCKYDDTYMAPSVHSDCSSYMGSSTRGSLYRGAGSIDLTGNSSMDGTLPVARVVPFPKPPRRPSGQTTAGKSHTHSRQRSTASTTHSHSRSRSHSRSHSHSSPQYAHPNRRKLPSVSEARPPVPAVDPARRRTTGRRRPHDSAQVVIRGSRSTSSPSGHLPDVVEFKASHSPFFENDDDDVYDDHDDDEIDSSKYAGVYAKVDDVEDDDGDDVFNVVHPKSERAYDKKIIYCSGQSEERKQPGPRVVDQYEIPVKLKRPPNPVPAPPVSTMPRTIAPPLPAQRKQPPRPQDRCSNWSTKTDWDPYDMEDDQSPPENEYMEIRDNHRPTSGTVDF